MRIPIRLMIDNVLELTLLIATAESDDLAQIVSEELDVYLTECGWDRKSFDKEYLELINEDWEPLLN